MKLLHSRLKANHATKDSHKEHSLIRNHLSYNGDHDVTCDTVAKENKGKMNWLK